MSANASAKPTARATGRTARTKGVSMLPTELDDVSTVEELTGVGFSEVYHRHFAPQMKAAAELLREASESGMELNRGLLRDVWHVDLTQAQLRSIYTAESEVLLGD